MSTGVQLPTKQLISQNAYIATTSTFLGIAVISAVARAFIRIHYLKRINVDDYFFFIAVLALIPGAGLFFSYIGPSYEAEAITEGKAPPPPNFIQTVENAATYATVAELLCWTTIFSIKFSFLFYFRALVNMLYKMEVWWWFTFAGLVPTAAISIAGVFIVCPHTGASILKSCGYGSAFVRREHGFLYYSVAADIVTDVMLISIPVIVLRTASFNLHRKLSIAIVVCLSLFMIAIALVRGISSGVIGTNNQAWNSFWVQLEASISVIAACPVAFRSVFLLNHNSKNSPNRGHGEEGQRSIRGKYWRRVNPGLPSIGVGATLTGMRTMIDKRQLESGHDDGYALSSNIMRSHQSSPSFEAPERGAKGIDEPLQTMV